MIIKSYHFSDLGNYRKINEDCVLILNKIFQPQNMKSFEYQVVNVPNPFFAIADGMGGHEKGEIASFSTLKFLMENMSQSTSPKEFKSLLFKAKSNLNEIATSNQSPGLGTTFTGTYFFQNLVHIFNIGDSRVYRIRRRKLERITDDHSEVFELFSDGKITEDEMRTHKHKNLLTSALIGDLTNQKPNIFEKSLPIQIGDLFLLCSDGLWEGIPLAHLEKIFLENSAEEEICSELIHFSLKYGGMDNLSFILLKVVDT